MANRYWVGDGGNWWDSNHWSTTSGGSGGASAPTSSDDVYFDANSFTLDSQTVSCQFNQFYCKDMDWTGATNSPRLYVNGTIDMGTGTLTHINCYGSMTFIENMTVNIDSTYAGFKFYGAGNETITTAGHVFGQCFFLQDGTLDINGEFEARTGYEDFVINCAGTVNFNNDANIFVNNRSFLLTTGTVNINGDLLVWGYQSAIDINGGTLNLADGCTVHGPSTIYFDNGTINALGDLTISREGGSVYINSSFVDSIDSSVTFHGPDNFGSFPNLGLSITDKTWQSGTITILNCNIVGDFVCNQTTTINCDDARFGGTLICNNADVIIGACEYNVSFRDTVECNSLTVNNATNTSVALSGINMTVNNHLILDKTYMSGGYSSIQIYGGADLSNSWFYRCLFNGSFIPFDASNACIDAGGNQNLWFGEQALIF